MKWYFYVICHLQSCTIRFVRDLLHFVFLSFISSWATSMATVWIRVSEEAVALTVARYSGPHGEKIEGGSVVCQFQFGTIWLCTLVRIFFWPGSYAAMC